MPIHVKVLSAADYTNWVTEQQKLLAAAADDPTKVWTKEDLIVRGQKVYDANCAACHQAGGEGMAGVFPPLAGSEWVLGKDTTVANIVLHGINGSLTVKGASYNGAMPAFKDQLHDAQIAALLTYVRSQWGNQAAAVTTETVAQVRKDSQARTEPFKGDAELASMH